MKESPIFGCKRGERSLILALGHGWLYKEIAFQLGTSESAVKSRVRHLMKKWGISSFELQSVGRRALEAMAS